MYQAAQYLSVPVEIWYQWSQSYRQKYVKLIKSFERKDIDAQKTSDIEGWGRRENNLQQAKKSLSIKLSESLLNLLHAETIEKKALGLLNIGLLNNPTALFLSPSIVVEKKEKIYLAAGKTHPETYRVTVSETSLVKCSCKGLRYSSLCSHSVAVAEKEGTLQIHIGKFKNSASRESVTYPIKANGAGRKRDQKRSERTCSSSTEKSVNEWQHPFTETWHNNEPFMTAKRKDIPIERSLCACCQKEFPHGPLAIVPFDTVVTHRERWMCMNRNRTSDTEPLYIPSSAKKLTTKYYYIR